MATNVEPDQHDGSGNFDPFRSRVHEGWDPQMEELRKRYSARVERALRVLRTRHTRPERMRWAARIAGEVYLVEVVAEHAADGVPPVGSGYARCDWCGRDNAPRPCADVVRAWRLAQLGREPRRRP
ncbi:hypothetical protein Afil01_31710 [Actinorhabdospora filicis]|uniref:Uncharacterized protein n=1 Tax=Actinorhabdospora filicis TaxID=1785913 RepID=A0A9W6W997_9ACTN|nr:hypothetical protein Afil01_31710 [Actinorhabdospora filicis]